MRKYVWIWSCLLLFCGACHGQQTPVVDTGKIAHTRLTDSAHAAARQGDTVSAMQFHHKALHHARKHGLQEHEARSLVHIAQLLKSEDAAQGLSHLDNALKIAERLQKQDLKADILLAKAGIFKQQRNYNEALAALEAHQRLLQNVFNSNKAQEIARVRATENHLRERVIFITVLLALMLVAGVFAYYNRRTNRLNRALRESNHIKDRLFSIIGHDLRGPAGVIMQALEMVDTGVLDDSEEKEVIGLLKQQSRSFNETLNSLLNWAAAQLKGAEPHIGSVSTLETIRKTLDLLGPQAAAKEIRINTNYEDGLSVLADEDQLDFVLRNLVSNAIKFSFPGGEIDIKAKKHDNSAVIAVHDNGKGIPTNKQAELLNERQLASTYGTKGEKGTGLGLMLSWDFIKANRGRLWFDSQEGTGTTFYISLPLA